MLRGRIDPIPYTMRPEGLVWVRESAPGRPGCDGDRSDVFPWFLAHDRAGALAGFQGSLPPMDVESGPAPRPEPSTRLGAFPPRTKPEAGRRRAMRPTRKPRATPSCSVKETRSRPTRQRATPPMRRVAARSRLRPQRRPFEDRTRQDEDRSGDRSRSPRPQTIASG